MYLEGMTKNRLLSVLSETRLIPPDIHPHFRSLLPDSPVKTPITEIDILTAGSFADSEKNCDCKCGHSNASETYSEDQEDTFSTKSGCEIADIFRVYGRQYRQHNHLTVDQQKAMHAIENCRTGSLGFHVDICDTCGTIDIGANSCRNGHCPKCQSNKRFEWVEARIDDMLPVPYYHIVFTLPDCIYPMCLYNQKVIYDILFLSSAQALKKFGNDPKWLGADMGFFGIIHTWGQLLTVHLHIHWIVPAGGIDKDGNWVEPKFEKNNFLFPVRALSEVYRGMFVEKLKQARLEGKLEFPGELDYLENDYDFENWINGMVSKNWVVYAKKPFDSPKRVIAYVGRYTHRVAISNSRIISIDNGIIRFSYKNYKNQKAVRNRRELWEETELSACEFIRRFLHHIFPRGYHRIRYFGFLGNGCKKKLHDIRNRMRQESDQGIPEKKEDRRQGRLCPTCEKGSMIPIMIVDANGKVLKGSLHELITFKRQLDKGLNVVQRPCIQDSS